MVDNALDEERTNLKKLAKKLAGWGIVRGFALMATLRYFWRTPEAGIAACAAPEVWMTPTIMVTPSSASATR